MENSVVKGKAAVKKSSRNYGVDLLRCISMAMVVMLHVLSKSELIAKSNALAAEYEIAWVIELACYCAVNCFILISGYVGINSKFRLSRILSLWAQVVFYNVAVEVFCQLLYQFTHMSDFTIDFADIICAFFPVTTKAYWFFTQYIVLCFFMPFINKCLKSISLRQNTALVGAIVVFFSVIPTASGIVRQLFGKDNLDIFVLNNGYSAIWMIAVYIIGAYIKRLYDENKIPKIKNSILFAVYVASVMLNWFIKLIFEIALQGGVKSYNIVSYTSVFTLICSVCLLMIFSSLKLKDSAVKIIAWASPFAFAVYLIHVQKTMFNGYFGSTIKIVVNSDIVPWFITVFLITAAVYILCTFVDFFRAKLFNALKIDALCRKADKFALNKWLED